MRTLITPLLWLAACGVPKDRTEPPEPHGGHVDVVVPRDADGDGWLDAASGGADCDDADPKIHPDATDLPGDSLDQDCDGHDTCYADADGDGHGTTPSARAPLPDGCGAAPGTAAVPGDCDDGDPTVGGPATWYADGDADGHGDPATPWVTCEAASGWVLFPDDCDDADPARHPGAPEQPGDRVDQDCDGSEDCWVDGDGDGLGSDLVTPVAPADPCPAGTAASTGDCDDADPALGRPTWYPDVDRDGRGDPTRPLGACTPPPGFLADASDCDDADPALPRAWFHDADGDGHGSGEATEDCAAPTLHVPNGDDCDDTTPAVHPGASERCNGLDDDCDGLLDAADDDVVDAVDAWPDLDRDAWGRPGPSLRVCVVTSGLAGRAGDCDDQDGTIHPGAPEVCGDGVDQDCDARPGPCGLAGTVTHDAARHVVVGSVRGDLLGSAVLGGFDATQDGVPDVFVSAPSGATPGGYDTGRLYLFSGATLPPYETSTFDARTVVYGLPGGKFGYSLAAFTRGPEPTLLVSAPGPADDPLLPSGARAHGLVYRLGLPVPAALVIYAESLDAVWSGHQGQALGHRLALGDPLGLGRPMALVSVRGPGGHAAALHPDVWSRRRWDTTEPLHGTLVVAGTTLPSGREADDVASAGDVLGDAGDDVAFAWRDGSGNRGVTVVGGWSAQLTLDPSQPPGGLPSVTFTVPSDGGDGRLRVRLVPDVTGDARDDLVIGLPCLSACAHGGDVWVLPGGHLPSSGVHPLDHVGTLLAGAHVRHPIPASAFGSALARAGDVDGDGQADLIVGSPLEQAGRGAAYVLYGPLAAGELALDALVSERRAARLVGPQEPATFGVDVTTAGDLDGDGFDEVVVGAPLASVAGIGAFTGAVYVFAGGGD